MSYEGSTAEHMYSNICGGPEIKNLEGVESEMNERTLYCALCRNG